MERKILPFSTRVDGPGRPTVILKLATPEKSDIK